MQEVGCTCAEVSCEMRSSFNGVQHGFRASDGDRDGHEYDDRCHREDADDRVDGKIRICGHYLRCIVVRCSLVFAVSDAGCDETERYDCYENVPVDYASCN